MHARNGRLSREWIARLCENLMLRDVHGVILHCYDAQSCALWDTSCAFGEKIFISPHQDLMRPISRIAFENGWENNGFWKLPAHSVYTSMLLYFICVLSWKEKSVTLTHSWCEMTFLEQILVVQFEVAQMVVWPFFPDLNFINNIKMTFLGLQLHT